MNTDDERREEFTKKTQSLDQSALNNGAINGEILSEANELDDLKKENNIRTCFSNKNFQEKFPCILVKYKSNNFHSDSFDSKQTNLNEQKLSGSLSSGIYSHKKKKAHYTIRRAPGKIAHLLIQPREPNRPQDSPKAYFSETSSHYELKESNLNIECKVANETLDENRYHSKRTSSMANVEIRKGSDTNREKFFNLFRHKKVTKKDETVDVFLKKDEKISN